MPTPSVNLYDHAYGDFTGDAEAAVRRETYGEDLGQTSWLTAPEWLGFADRAGIGASSDVLEVGSGSGGPGIYLAEQRGCRLTGVDLNEHGVRNANALAASRGLTDRVRFDTVDASRPLPFDDGRFDAVLSNDAMCHIRHRDAVLRDWYRVLRPGGRALFTDALVITGIVSHEEIANRSSIGFYLFVPPGENERLLAAAGFDLLGVDDVTQNAADIPRRRHDARERYRDALIAREGQANFDGLQRFLMGVHTLSAERRLSRFAYLAEKPAR
jgi:SAM-dependent methyltransferase